MSVQPFGERDRRWSKQRNKLFCIIGAVALWTSAAVGEGRLVIGDLKRSSFAEVAVFVLAFGFVAGGVWYMRVLWQELSRTRADMVAEDQSTPGRTFFAIAVMAFGVISAVVDLTR